MRVAEIDDRVLVEAVKASSSWAELKRLCGLSMGGAVHQALRRRTVLLGLSTDHLHGRSLVYSDEQLRELVHVADSVADVLRALGLSQAGGTHAHLSRRIRALGCDTSHFTRRAKARTGARSLEPANVLVQRPGAEKRRSSTVLTKALIGIGRPHVCAGCGTEPAWRGLRLVLSVDHVDGDWRNDEAHNLRFLCPNCHSQTPTFCRRPCDRVSARGGTRTPKPFRTPDPKSDADTSFATRAR